MMNGTTVTVLFGEATAQQQPSCDTLAGSAWGTYLDEDEVLGRERHLRAQSLVRDGGCRTWCLYRQDDHDQVLSCCKTMRRDLLLRDAEGLHDTEGYCITSVFTTLVYRGHGLASYMLQNVVEWLDGPGKAAVSLLYSGIPQFYESLGWTTLPNLETVLSISPWLQDVLETYADLEVRTLCDSDLEELCIEDVRLCSKHLTIAETGLVQGRLHILPVRELLGYQHALADYMGELWHGQAPEIRGAAYKTEAWLYWHHDFRGRCLRIQRIHNAIGDEELQVDTIAALFLAAIREAKEWNFTTVATWDVTDVVRKAMETLAKASAFTKSLGESHRTQRISVRWRHGETRVRDVFMDNEAYAWNQRY